MEFRTLGVKERNLLLIALDFNTTSLRCQYCKDAVHLRKCGIMPSVKTKKLATILCDSVLCMCEYLKDADSQKEA